MKEAFLLAALAATGCSAELEIAGDYTDEWGSAHTITEETWRVDWPAEFHVVSYDNHEGVVIAHNDADNAFNPDQFSRLDWTFVDGDLFYCQTAYDAASAEDAQGTARADESDPAAGGCGPGPWTNLTP